jgi:hypothetical protein
MDALLAAVELLTASLVLTVVHFPLEATRSLLSFGLAPAVGFARRKQVRAIASNTARTRETLGHLMNEGRLILARLRDPAKDSEASRAYAQSWTAQVEEFLHNELGRSYVNRFHIPSEVGDHEIAGVPSEQLSDWKNLRNYVFNLELFSTEL